MQHMQHTLPTRNRRNIFCSFFMKVIQFILNRQVEFDKHNISIFFERDLYILCKNVNRINATNPRYI